MPNSANKSDKKNGIVKPKRKTTKADPNASPEKSDMKQADASKGTGGRSSDSGSSRTRGGSPDA